MGEMNDELGNVILENACDNFSAFDIPNILKLTEKYPYDFIEDEKRRLPVQLENYIDFVKKDKQFTNLDGLSSLVRPVKDNGQKVDIKDLGVDEKKKYKNEKMMLEAQEVEQRKIARMKNYDDKMKEHLKFLAERDKERKKNKHDDEEVRVIKKQDKEIPAFEIKKEADTEKVSENCENCETLKKPNNEIYPTLEGMKAFEEDTFEVKNFKTKEDTEVKNSDQDDERVPKDFSWDDHDPNRTSDHKAFVAQIVKDSTDEYTADDFWADKMKEHLKFLAERDKERKKNKHDDEEVQVIKKQDKEIPAFEIKKEADTEKVSENCENCETLKKHKNE
ncbi:myb-like protein X [Helianthus annuus]|uniref:myb-like protein X n=1 Tax=Helianthus annuus TaxID=4232 RepID=UPI001652D5EE|nr:myb-like protein X [Helianthus annuus]